MRQLRLLLGLGLLAAVLGCQDKLAPPTTGSISLRLQSPPEVTGASVAMGAEAQIESPAEPAGHLQTIRVTVAGATNKTQTFTCTAAVCTGTVDGLAPGSYSVVVEGLVGTAVDYFGQTSGVAVQAGGDTPATISFQSFRPVLASFGADTTEVLRFRVTYSKVPAAGSYNVEWARAADFSNSSTVTLADTTTEITVTQEALYYVRVRAVNSVVTAGGNWSAPKSIFAFQGVASVTVTPATPTIADGATQQFAAEARDGDNNVVANVSFFWSSSDPAIVSINQSGLASARRLGQATITAVGKGQPGSTSITVTFGAAAKLSFKTPAATAEPFRPINPVEVAVQDARGNQTAAAVAVTIAIGDDPSNGAATLSGTTTVTSVAGVATFSNLSIDVAGEGYTLNATATGLTTALGTDFDVALEFVQMTTARYHSCGLTTTGAAYCWGYGGLGSRGDSSFTPQDVPTPVRVVGGHTFTALSAGGNFSCGLQANGAAYCWGAGASGQLGNNGTSNQFEPVLVQGGHTFLSISAGEDHACGVRNDGIVLCWGAAANGRLGNNTTTPNALVPVATTGGTVFSSVSAGNLHTCGIQESDGRVLCWGAAANGRLGNNLTAPDVLVPSLTTNGQAFLSVSAGSGTSSSHTCGVRADLVAMCWGNGTNGRVGDGNAAAHDVLNPTVVVGSVRFSMVSAGPVGTCAVTTSGAAMCWGSAIAGSLGNGTDTGDFPAPVAVVGGRIFESLESNHNVYGTTCGVALGGAFCWGYNGDGQLGIGLIGGQSSVPVQVVGSR